MLNTHLKSLAICESDSGTTEALNTSQVALNGPIVGGCLEAAVCEAQVVVDALQDGLLRSEVLCMPRRVMCL